ncbi:acetyl-CoA synthetase-like protein [Armillaria solidipes]|uniref:Acetyl-CoA synthetase-like protein n=1 Tax=Armillaria solidipes TaxID=1076256 RepID=A0A2H3BGB2_9AGAR|nr:acetyl-CoA synthetase-like protein [Armillaria solidipes]
MSFSEHRVIPPPPQKQGEQSTTFLPPPIDGSFTVQQMYDWHLHHSPNHRIFVYAREDGSLRNICWAEAVAAAYTCARLMNTRIPFVVILLESSRRSNPASCRESLTCQLRCFPISPRNLAPVVARLLHEVGVEHVLVGRDASMQDLSHEALDILGSQYPSADLPQLSPIPVFEDLFMPDWRTRTNSDDLPLLSVDPSTTGLYLHSSGSSTSYPRKPITWNCHRLIEHTLVPWFGGRDLCDVVFAVHGLSMYHGMDIFAFLCAVSSGLVLSVFEPKVPATSPTLDNMFVLAKATNSDIVFCAPYILEALSHEPERIDWLSTCSGALYGGGPLNKEVGDHLTSRGVSIFVLYGSTECGVVTPILPAKASDYWDYFEFTKFATPKMVASCPDLFEFIAVKNEFSEPSVINTNVDGTDGFATSDLFIPHSTKPGYWKIIGRIDDQIVHNTGRKTNPGPLGIMLNQDPHVLAAVMFGRGKYQVGVLVEPGPQFSFDPVDESKLAEFRNLIWPTVKKINQVAPQHSRLFKEVALMIIVTKPGRPLAYTAKNTVRRQAVLHDYRAEIATLYETVEDHARCGILPPLEWNDTSTLEFVRNVVLQTLPRPVLDNQDLFQQGCDSLQATQIRNILLRALRDSVDLDTRQSSDDLVYSNPSIIQLAKFLVSITQ